MAERLTAAVWHTPIPAQAKLTLLALAWLADDSTGRARLSPKEIWTLSNASRSTTYRAITFLEERGHIKVRRDKHGCHACYTLNVGEAERRYG